MTQETGTLNNTLRSITALLAVLTIGLAACQPLQPIEPATPPVEATAEPTAPSDSETDSDTEPDGAEAADLVGTAWTLASINATGTETPVASGSTVTLEFGADGRAGGDGGCNTYGGGYQVQGNTLTFEQMVSTLMACADNAVTQQEQTYLRLLETVETFSVEDGELTLYDETGQSVLVFTEGAASPSA